MNINDFVVQYQSFQTALEQEKFLYQTFPRTFSLTQTRESLLLEKLLSVQNNRVRFQLLGVKLLLAYRDTDRLFELLVNHKAYSANVYLLAIKSGSKLLSVDQVNELLFPTNDQYAPVFLNALVKAISQHKRCMINKDLLMRVAAHASFSKANVLILLAGLVPNGDESDDLIVDMIVNVLHENDPKIFKNLVKNHPLAVLKLLREIQQRLHSSLTEFVKKSYNGYVAPMSKLATRYSDVIKILASKNKEINLKVIQLIRDWFVSPLEQRPNPTGMVSGISLPFASFTLNIDAFLDLLEDGNASKKLITMYTLSSGLSLLVKKYSIQQLVRLFELLVGKDFNVPDRQSEIALCFLTSIPVVRLSSLAKVEAVQKQLWQKHGEQFENWLLKKIQIGQLCHLIPELGSRIADKKFRVAQLTTPELSQFQNKCTYLKYIESSVSNDEQLTEFTKHCSNPEPEVRAVVMSSLLFASLYHRTNLKHVLKFVLEKLANERDEFMNCFGNRIYPDSYMGKHCNTLYSIIRANIVQDDELLALWGSLIKLIARKTSQPIQNYLLTVSGGYRNKEEKKKLSLWSLDVGKSCSTSDRESLVKRMGFDQRRDYQVWNFECLSKPLLEYFQEQESKWRFGELATLLQNIDLACLSKQFLNLYKTLVVPALFTLPMITEESNIRGIMYLVNISQYFYSPEEIDDIFSRLLDTDPSFIFCSSVQRWVFSRRTPFSLVERYLSLNENCTMSFDELRDLNKNSSHLLTHQSDCTYCLNPHIMREQKIERYISEETMNKVTRMMVNTARITLTSNHNLSSTSFVPPDSMKLQEHVYLPQGHVQKRLLQFAGRMQMEKQEAVFFRKLVDDVILSLAEEEETKIKDDVLGIAKMSKYLTAYHPEELLQEILDVMRSDYALYYYCALMRCSSFGPLQQWILHLSGFINQKQADLEMDIFNPNWSVTLQKLLFSWIKRVWLFKTDFSSPQLITTLLNSFKSHKTHKDTKLMIIGVFLRYVASTTNPEEPDVQRVLPVIINSLSHEYEQIPRTITSSVYQLSFKSREIRNSLIVGVSQLLSHENAKTCFEAWKTTSQGLMALTDVSLPKNAIDQLANQCTKQLLSFDRNLRQDLVAHAISVYLTILSYESGLADNFMNTMASLISDQQYIDMDLKFVNELGFDRPRIERLKLICDRLVNILSDNRELKSVITYPFLDLLLKFEPMIYFSQGVWMSFSLAQTLEEIIDALSIAVRNICSLTNPAMKTIGAQSVLDSVMSSFNSFSKRLQSGDFERLVQHVQSTYEQLPSDNSLEFELWASILYIALRTRLEQTIFWTDCPLISSIREKSRVCPLVGYVCVKLPALTIKPVENSQ